jgi:hypothetical protein
MVRPAVAPERVQVPSHSWKTPEEAGFSRARPSRGLRLARFTHDLHRYHARSPPGYSLRQWVTFRCESRPWARTALGLRSVHDLRDGL